MTEEHDTLLVQLEFLERHFLYWESWNKKLRDKEGLPTEDDTHVIQVPPTWPSHGQLKAWADTMRRARTTLATVKETP